MVRTRLSQLTQELTQDSSNQPAHHSSTNLAKSLNDECSSLLLKINQILAKKAPECIQLVNDLISMVSSVSSVSEEKRKRSAVVYGVEEADRSLPAVERQKFTEKKVEGILNALDIETRPVEVFRMGKPQEGKPRLIKIVFSSRSFFFDALRNAQRLRNNSLYSGIYLRRSMTADERDKDRALRAEARELNTKEGGGRKIYVVYKQKIVKASEISSLSRPFSKN
ncbi:hypothetical protein ANCDUO_19945 [Ancylostoma duodenale]|uniref:Uncharacterized protein n=1 Tax=Ancylostoma duodenale TaxID=51022 RepID=A0A0C2FTH3_9BILA|nr:hypothetical protein ANCDUO_19945 [Ancylostoma duodenale]